MLVNTTGRQKYKISNILYLTAERCMIKKNIYGLCGLLCKRDDSTSDACLKKNEDLYTYDDIIIVCLFVCFVVFLLLFFFIKKIFDVHVWCSPN